jgi:hypothetical protein
MPRTGLSRNGLVRDAGNAKGAGLIAVKTARTDEPAAGCTGRGEIIRLALCLQATLERRQTQCCDFRRTRSVRRNAFGVGWAVQRRMNSPLQGVCGAGLHGFVRADSSAMQATQGIQVQSRLTSLTQAVTNQLYPPASQACAWPVPVRAPADFPLRRVHPVLPCSG